MKILETDFKESLLHLLAIKFSLKNCPCDNSPTFSKRLILTRFANFVKMSLFENVGLKNVWLLSQGLKNLIEILGI
jgi:hypothetical protein